VAREVLAHIGAADLVALALFGDDDDVDRLGAFQERHGVADGARSRAPAVPARKHALERHAALLDIGHDDHGTPGFEQRPFDQQVVGCSTLALRLTDHGEIEAARDLGEQRGGAAERRVEDARFRRNSRLFRPRFEPADRVIGDLAVFRALELDQVDGNASERAVGDHRLVEEGDAGDAGAERCGDRDRIVGREVARAAARKVDNDILEHSLTLLATRRACGNPQTSLCKSTLARLRCNADKTTLPACA
jgi:hypothetical protein